MNLVLNNPFSVLNIQNPPQKNNNLHVHVLYHLCFQLWWYEDVHHYAQHARTQNCKRCILL
jgi:hypothetical protein